MGLSIDFEWILAISLIARSAKCKSSGRIPAATSFVSRPEVIKSVLLHQGASSASQQLSREVEHLWQY